MNGKSSIDCAQYVNKSTKAIDIGSFNSWLTKRKTKSKIQNPTHGLKVFFSGSLSTRFVHVETFVIACHSLAVRFRCTHSHPQMLHTLSEWMSTHMRTYTRFPINIQDCCLALRYLRLLHTFISSNPARHKLKRIVHTFTPDFTYVR